MDVPKVYPDWLFDGSDRLHEKQAISRWLRTRAEAFNDTQKQLDLSFLTTSEHTNFMGIVHGGVVGAMLDEAASIAAICLVGWERFRGTVDSHVIFLKPLTPGPTTARAVLIHETARLLAIDAELVGPQGDRCAKATCLISTAPAPQPASEAASRLGATATA